MGIAVKFARVTKYYSRTSPLSLLRKSATNKSILGVSNVSLEVPTGEIFGLIGRNGQGKTTLVKCLAGLIEPTEGSIEIFEQSNLSNRNSARRKIGLVSSDERSFYWRLTGWQNLLFFSRLHGMNDAEARKRINPLLDHFGLQDLAKRRFDGYSAGNKQRLAIVRALLNDPMLLILDEPTRSLDPIAADALHEMIRQWKNEHPQRTAIITSHNLVEIESLCDRIGILSRNTLVECATMEELRLKFPAHDRVTILLRSNPNKQDWMWIKDRVPSLSWKRVETGQWQLQFSHWETEVDLVLKELVRAGDEIRACNMVRIGLREILERIEEGD